MVQDPMKAVLLCGFVIATALAGCMSDTGLDPAEEPEEEPEAPSATPVVSEPPPQRAEEARATEKAGSVQGRVMDTGLEAVAGAEVFLFTESGAEEVASTVADEDGYFTINDVEPGEYRLQVAAACCHQGIRSITVEAGEVTKGDFQLERLSSSELRRAYKEGPFEITGFISCGTNAVVLLIPCNADPNHANTNPSFLADAGLKTIHFGLEWEPSLPTGERLMMSVYSSPGTYEYGGASGESPLEFRLDDQDVEDPEFRFPEDGEIGIRLTIRPAEGEALVFQQQFTFYYTLHFWDPAPEGFSTLPGE